MGGYSIGRATFSMYTLNPRLLTDLSGHGQALGVGDGCQLLVPQPFNRILVIAEVQLGAHQEDGCVWAVVPHLWVPLWGQRF